MFRHAFIPAVLTLSIGACQSSPDGGFGHLQQADVLPDGEVIVTYAELTASLVPGQGGGSVKNCALPDIRAQLLSAGGGGLRLLTITAPATGCTNSHPEIRSYDLIEGRYVAGRKIYEGESALGRLWLYDNRMFGAGPAWTVMTFDMLADIDPTYESWRTHHAEEVTDTNQEASGDNRYELEVQLAAPMAPADFAKLCHPLLIDPAATGPLDPTRPDVYRVTVISDLSPPHVLSQLRILSLVRSAQLLGAP